MKSSSSLEQFLIGESPLKSDLSNNSKVLKSNSLLAENQKSNAFLRKVHTNSPSIEDFQRKIKQDTEMMLRSKNYLSRVKCDGLWTKPGNSPVLDYYMSSPSECSSLFSLVQTKENSVEERLVESSPTAPQLEDSDPKISSERKNSFEANLSQESEENIFDTVKIKRESIQPKTLRKSKKRGRKGKRRVKPEIRKGDWFCPKCNNQNFSFRDVCNKCSLKKYEQVA